ncbi:unnamed protein product [marine sediment metagenome]|uniref:Uncharacterized protein n=1 Tax=marine sediment metagenome TaxID=412755 RepID=X1DW51_9ZZZZ
MENLAREIADLVTPDIPQLEALHKIYEDLIAAMIAERNAKTLKIAQQLHDEKLIAPAAIIRDEKITKAKDLYDNDADMFTDWGHPIGAIPWWRGTLCLILWDNSKPRFSLVRSPIVSGICTA